MKIKRNREHKEKRNFFSNLFIFVSLIWFLIGVFYLCSEINRDYRDYSYLISLSLEDKRAVISGGDFYRFLMFCDKTIPKGSDIKWVFPEGGFLGNSEYHFFKAYYYLYPRNYRENAGYIIVYGKEAYNAPSGFKLFEEFRKDEYILSRD